MDFTQLGINQELKSALVKNYITTPTEVQESVIPNILKGRNIIAKSQTGTGKTLAFVLPILQLTDSEKAPQAIILAPTRELSAQTYDVTKQFGEYICRDAALVIGGHDVISQKNKLSNAQILIGTPGRILDHINQGNIYLKNIKYLVIDEADQMMVYDFLEDISLLASKLPDKLKIMLFSATMPSKVIMLSKKLIKNPVRIDISKSYELTENISHIFVNTNYLFKYKAFKIFMEIMNPFMAIVFCSSRKSADELYDRLSSEKISCGILHGDFSQKKRETTLNNFRKMKFVYLITTDISARGFDIDGVTHVVNYDLPAHSTYYVHRVGRTGRMDEKGTAISFAEKKDIFKADKIKSKIKTDIYELNYNNDTEEKNYKSGLERFKNR